MLRLPSVIIGIKALEFVNQNDRKKNSKNKLVQKIQKVPKIQYLMNQSMQLIAEQKVNANYTFHFTRYVVFPLTNLWSNMSSTSNISSDPIAGKNEGTKKTRVFSK